MPSRQGLLEEGRVTPLEGPLQQGDPHSHPVCFLFQVGVPCSLTALPPKSEMASSSVPCFGECAVSPGNGELE